MNKSHFWALIICGCMAGNAEASTYSIGTLTSAPIISSDWEPPGRFTDRYDFSIETASTGTVSVTNVPLKFFDVKILNIRDLTANVFDSSDNLLIAGNQLSWLAEPGAYHATIVGRATGYLGGVYALALSATPVPLPATLWLFISGAAGIVAMGRRCRI